MHLKTIDYIFWCADPFLMMAIAASMYRRHLYRDFPLFFTYVVFQVLSFAVELPLRHSTFFYYVSWATTALSMVLTFAVLLEIFRDTLRPYPALRDLSMRLFRWCAVVALLAAGMWAITSWHRNQIDNVTNGIYMLGRSVRIMQCGLVCFMLLFSQHLGISKRNVVFGISIGFGFYAAVNLLIMTALSDHTITSKMTLSRVNNVAYLVAAVVWLAYTALPAKERCPVRATTAASQNRDYGVEDERNAPPLESLLDTLDQTVERLLDAARCGESDNTPPR